MSTASGLLRISGTFEIAEKETACAAGGAATSKKSGKHHKSTDERHQAPSSGRD